MGGGSPSLASLTGGACPALGGKAKQARPLTETDSSGGGRCAYTVELVKPADPEGTGRQREQRESWLWIKVLPHRH